MPESLCVWDWVNAYKRLWWIGFSEILAVVVAFLCFTHCMHWLLRKHWKTNFRLWRALAFFRQILICTCMSLPDFENFTFSIPFFSNNYSPISIPFRRKASNFAQIWCFFHILLKINPMWFGLLHLCWPLPSPIALKKIAK